MTINDVPGGRVQAQCIHCIRQSPILPLPLESALATLAELGWRDDAGALVCPICIARKGSGVRDR